MSFKKLNYAVLYFTSEKTYALKDINDWNEEKCREVQSNLKGKIYLEALYDDEPK
jgi:hypothetical protein